MRLIQINKQITNIWMKIMNQQNLQYIKNSRYPFKKSNKYKKRKRILTCYEYYLLLFVYSH